MSKPLYTGHCACRKTRFHITRQPLFVHCCHCTWCQRETGSAFVLNAIIEAANIVTDDAEGRASPVPIKTPSASGHGQTVFRCPACYVALWSKYGDGSKLRYVRVGTLVADDWGAEGSLPPLKPSIHIFTSTKMPWVVLPDDGTPIVEEYYDRLIYWPQPSLDRWMASRAGSS